MHLLYYIILMSKIIYDQIDSDFNKFTKFKKEEINIVYKYLSSLDEVLDTEKIIEKYSDFSTDKKLLLNTVDLLISLIRLGKFVYNNEEYDFIEIYHEVKSINKIFNEENFLNIFINDSFFSKSLNLDKFKDNLYNKLNELDYCISLCDFWNNEYFKKVELIINYSNDEKILFNCTINDIIEIHKKLEEIIIKSKNNDIKYIK